MIKAAVKVPPIFEPVSLEDIRREIGFSQEEDIDRDEVLYQRMIAAREFAEKRTGMAFLETTFTGYVDCWLPVYQLKKPLVSVSSVRYLDVDNILQTVDPSYYYVNTIDHCLCIDSSQSLPALKTRSNVIEIEFISGFQTPEHVPEMLRQLIRFIVSHWESYQSGIESTAQFPTIPESISKALLGPFEDYRGRL